MQKTASMALETAISMVSWRPEIFLSNNVENPRTLCFWEVSEVDDAPEISFKKHLSFAGECFRTPSLTAGEAAQVVHGTMPSLGADFGRLFWPAQMHLLLCGPLLYARFSAQFELGLDSASLVSWAKPKEDGGRWRTTLKGNQSRYAWVGHELAPMLQLTQDLSFCPTVTSWKCFPRGSRLPWKKTSYASLSAKHPTSLLCTHSLI